MQQELLVYHDGAMQLKSEAGLTAIMATTRAKQEPGMRRDSVPM